MFAYPWDSIMCESQGDLLQRTRKTMAVPVGCSNASLKATSYNSFSGVTRDHGVEQS
jgi:hypothetical protein